jgi:hypothetical protein
MYWFGCHCLVALYIATDSFKVEKTERTKSITLRTIRRAVMPNSRWDEALLSEKLQTENSRIWMIVTVEKGSMRQGATYGIPVYFPV